MDTINKIYELIPQNCGECSVCNGTGKNKENERCRNCGGQLMFGKPRGYVNLNNEGDPCIHEYNSRNTGRCLTEYSCKHCVLSFQIDSGDWNERKWKISTFY